MNTDEEFRAIFKECKSIAVIGLSSKNSRASNGVAAFMQENGYRVIPVNPNEISVLGEKSYSRLSEVPESIDLVNVFRRSEHAGEAVNDAIDARAKAVWLQEGVIDEAAAKRAEEAGLLVIMDRCWLKEWYSYGS